MYKNEIIKGQKRNLAKTLKPVFRNPSELSSEQLTNPDFALKQLEKLSKSNLSITCSKCHHCR